MKNFLVTARVTLNDPNIARHVTLTIAVEAEGPEEAYSFVDEWLKDYLELPQVAIADDMSIQPIDGIITTTSTSTPIDHDPGFAAHAREPNERPCICACGNEHLTPV